MKQIASKHVWLIEVLRDLELYIVENEMKGELPAAVSYAAFVARSEILPDDHGHSLPRLGVSSDATTRSLQ